VAEQRHAPGTRADELEARRQAAAGEFGILCQEAVARVDRIDARLVRHAQDVGDVEVRLHRPLAAADQVGLVGLAPVQREAVLLRVHRHGTQSELARRPHHANGDLAAVGDQNAADPLRRRGFHSNICRR
jgi:hypothetical protein